MFILTQPGNLPCGRKLSTESWRTLFTLARIEPTTSEVKGAWSDDCATETPSDLFTWRRQALHLAPFRNRAQIVTAKVTFSNNFAPAWCERDGPTANCDFSAPFSNRSGVYVRRSTCERSLIIIVCPFFTCVFCEIGYLKRFLYEF